MAKPNYPFAKRQRDLLKRQRKEEKRQRKAAARTTVPPHEPGLSEVDAVPAA